MFDTNFDPTEIAPESIDPDMDDMAPGPILAGHLSLIDVNNLSGHDRVILLRAHQRMASHYQGHVLKDMAAVTNALVDIERNRVEACESAAVEIGAALNLTRRTSDIELGFALDLAERLPEIRDMLTTGVIDTRRAR
ncbi:MAG: hypothetical protein QGM48_08365, partial [Actinomycetota bacterium]|nr:hypothetical protein [Actinomycetota bacterium]